MSGRGRIVLKWKVTEGGPTTWVGGTTLVSPSRSGFVTAFKSGSQCLCERGYGGITVWSWWSLHLRLVRMYVCRIGNKLSTQRREVKWVAGEGQGSSLPSSSSPSPPLPSSPLLFLPLQFYWLQWNICAASRPHQGKVVLQRTVSTTLQKSYFICDSVTSLQVVITIVAITEVLFYMWQCD